MPTVSRPPNGHCVLKCSPGYCISVPNASIEVWSWNQVLILVFFYLEPCPVSQYQPSWWWPLTTCLPLFSVSMSCGYPDTPEDVLGFILTHLLAHGCLLLDTEADCSLTHHWAWDECLWQWYRQAWDVPLLSNSRSPLDAHRLAQQAACPCYHEELLCLHPE